ncbi:MAG: hypothetical protein ACYDAG_05730 [Chloroflexota bacterium]
MERDCRRVQFAGLTFRFYFHESTDWLHIEHYGITIADVLETWAEGDRVWNADCRRWESRTGSHLLYWAWYRGREDSGQVVVISAREGE